MPLGLNSISGLISGLDTNSLVDSLIEFERRPAYLLEARKAREELRLATYDSLQGAMAKLQSQLEILRRPSDFELRRASVSDGSLLALSVDSKAALGSTTLRIQQLAQSHQIISQGYADPALSLGLGDVSVSLAGEEVLTVTLSEGADSLSDLAAAINAAGTDVSASVIDTGSGDERYRLVINGGKTGAGQLLTLTSDLSGGAGLDLGGVGPVVYQGTPPTASVTSGGDFAGIESAVYSFTVIDGGVVGNNAITISWSNDRGDSGEIVLDGSYVPGTEIPVQDGVTLSFGAGQLQTDSAWSVTATGNTLQSAQDAVVSLGSGEAPLQITSAANSITGLIDGVTLDLLAADPDKDVTIQVQRDTDALVERLSGFVDEYNSVVSFFESQMRYDQTSEAAGLLMGDRVALRLDSQLREDLVRAVAGLSGDLTLLSQIGIGSSVDGSIDTDGTLALDEARLREALAEDFDGVVALLGSTGNSEDEDIRFLNAGANVTPSGAGEGYELHVTQAAARGRYEGVSVGEPSASQALTIDASNRYLKISVNGVTSATLALEEGSVESGAELASRIQSAVNADETLDGKEVLVSWVDDGGGNGHLLITSKTYGASSNVTLEDVDDSIYGDAGLAGGSAFAGQDVAGYFLVDGEVETASGSGRILTGNAEDGATRSLSVEVLLSADALAAQGETQGRISVFSGIADRLHRSLSDVLDSVDGILHYRQEGMRSTIDDLEEQIDAVDARLEIRRERYLREFQRMEELLQEMSSNSSMFLSMLSSIGNSYSASSQG